MGLAELMEMIKKLSPEELEELKGCLIAGGKVDEQKDGNVEASEETASEEQTIDKVKEESLPNEEGESASEEETAKEEEIPTEEVKPDEENASDEGEETETESEESTDDDDIPEMIHGTPIEEVDTVDDDASIVAETGEKLPIDYEQVVEGLNAKIAALEAENTNLKNKVNGAFGYSAKPAVPAKVNRLYDECEDVHFSKN